MHAFMKTYNDIYNTHMQIVAVVSQKGGVGKTTLAIHLATLFSRAGKNTVLLDLDPQASASGWSDRRKEDIPVVISTHAKRLQSELDRIAQNDGEIVFIDTAPHSDPIALEAMRHANLVLIPTRPSILDIDAIVSTLQLAKLAEKIALVVLNACPARGQDPIEATTAITDLGVEVSHSSLTQRIGFARSLLYGKTVLEMEPTGKASIELQALGHHLNQKLQLLGEHDYVTE